MVLSMFFFLFFLFFFSPKSCYHDNLRTLQPIGLKFIGIHRFRYTLAIYWAFSEPWCWVRKVALAVWIPHIWCEARNITIFELSFWTFMKYVITLYCDICMHRYPNIVHKICFNACIYDILSEFDEYIFYLWSPEFSR